VVPAKRNSMDELYRAVLYRRCLCIPQGLHARLLFRDQNSETGFVPRWNPSFGAAPTLMSLLDPYAIDVSGRETQIDEAVNQHDSPRFLALFVHSG
jgi:hypothetical protein